MVAPLAAISLVLASATLLRNGSEVVPDGTGPPVTLPPVTFPAEQAGDLWVAETGADAARGTRDAPLATIQAAVDRVKPGRTIWLEPGSYTGFRATRSGEPGLPIVVAGQPDATAVVVPRGSEPATIDLSDAHDVALLNLSVTGTSAQQGAAVYLDGSTSIRISGSAVRGTHHGYGIDVRFSSSVEIDGNDISDNAVGVRLFGEGDSDTVDDVVISRNRIHNSNWMIVDDSEPDNDFGANAISWHKVTGRTSAIDNEIWDNHAPSHDYGSDGGAFEIWGSSNLTISDNTAWNNENVMETGSDGPPCFNITFVRNTAWVTQGGVGLILRCAEHGLVAHNLFDSVEDYAFNLSDRSGGNRFATSIDGLRVVDNIVVNSIVYEIANEIPSSVETDYNLVWEPLHQPVARFPGFRFARTMTELAQLTGRDQHSLEADPLFVDAAGRDYRLLVGSPAIDSGSVLAPGEPFDGTAPDIGPSEGAVPLPSPS